MIPLSISPQRPPKKGDLLLSEPFLIDDHFSRSVILLCDHNEDGSFGFILNNTIDLKLHDFAAGFPDLEARIGYGGPVDRNQLFFIHSSEKLEDSIEVCPGIYIGGNYQSLLDLLQKEEIDISDIRFFIGYTGWGPDQLMEELKEKTWIVAPVPESVSVMQTPDNTLWKDILNELGGKYKFMADYPLNPSDN